MSCLRVFETCQKGRVDGVRAAYCKIETLMIRGGGGNCKGKGISGVSMGYFWFSLVLQWQNWGLTFAHVNVVPSSKVWGTKGDKYWSLPDSRLARCNYVQTGERRRDILSIDKSHSVRMATLEYYFVDSLRFSFVEWAGLRLTGRF